MSFVKFQARGLCINLFVTRRHLFYVWHRVSYCPRWAGTPEDDPELLILLASYPKRWDFRHLYHTYFYGMLLWMSANKLGTLLSCLLPWLMVMFRPDVSLKIAILPNIFGEACWIFLIHFMLLPFIKNGWIFEIAQSHFKIHNCKARLTMSSDVKDIHISMLQYSTCCQEKESSIICERDTLFVNFYSVKTLPQ